ncbi:MAG: hypothetical protein HOG73_09815 [Candidatus Marinimicrobia bacterium]|nr:hypothetical protein [Candidatus Neomarinimicrobiota bacterium]
MTKTVVDIVNFNADASCLPSSIWLEALKGGTNSVICQWLSLFIKNKRKVTLGFTGSTIADIKIFNPDAIKIINENKDIFEIILRPWSHDISLYRTDSLFIYNVELGIRTIKSEFESVSNYYLAPEFMITSRQIELISKMGIDAIFINPDRYQNDIKRRIIPKPHIVYGTSESTIKCITIHGSTTQKYLSSCQLNDPKIWDQFIQNFPDDLIFSWRDGESFLLIPDGLSREEYLLQGESENINRSKLHSLEINYEDSSLYDLSYYKSYPIHSFTAWIKEMKMMWYIDRIGKIENNYFELTDFQKTLLLQMINSDILASVEKISPKIKLKVKDLIEDFIIYRSERGFEGEDYLQLIENPNYNNHNAPHIKKLVARHEYLMAMQENVFD